MKKLENFVERNGNNFGAVTHAMVDCGNLAEQGFGVVFVEAEEPEVLVGGGSNNQQELLRRVVERVHREVVEEQKINRKIVEKLGSSSSLPETNKHRGETSRTEFRLLLG
ncbi:hypothetical protein S83_047023 [Arachis hypogaea]|nr:uncharacterized protein DS421_14g464450 [Arachis hypogaea]